MQEALASHVPPLPGSGRHMKALHTFWQAIRDLYDDLLLFAGASLLWWLATLLIIPGPPATAGLVYLAHRVVNEQRVEISFFWQEFKGRFRTSWLVGGTSLLVLILIIVNFLFYSSLGNFLKYAVIVWAYLFLMWLAMQVYLFPLIWEMQDPRFGWLLRNAVMLALARPGYTLVLLVLLAAAAALSAILPFLLVLVWPALVALVCARATAHVIAESTDRQSTPVADES